MTSRTRQFVYWDACVFRYYLEAHPQYIQDISSVLDEIIRAKGKIVTSILSKVEVAYVTIENQGYLDEGSEEIIDTLWANDSVFELIELSDKVATTARGFMRDSANKGWKLKPADAIHLASAQYVGASIIHTYDKDWPRYNKLLGCEICPPHPQQYSLPE